MTGGAFMAGMPGMTHRGGDSRVPGRRADSRRPGQSLGRLDRRPPPATAGSIGAPPAGDPADHGVRGHASVRCPQVPYELGTDPRDGLPYGIPCSLANLGQPPA
jgi:hypothetical protein